MTIVIVVGKQVRGISIQIPAVGDVDNDKVGSDVSSVPVGGRGDNPSPETVY